MVRLPAVSSMVSTHPDSHAPIQHRAPRPYRLRGDGFPCSQATSDDGTGTAHEAGGGIMHARSDAEIGAAGKAEHGTSEQK